MERHTTKRRRRRRRRSFATYFNFCFKSSSKQVASTSSIQTRSDTKRLIASTSSIQTRSNTRRLLQSSSLPDFYLPEECWESISKFINYPHTMKSISLVSKQFLSITNRLQLSLTIRELTLPFLSRLLQRFHNLISLNLRYFGGDMDALLRKISRFSLNLKSLNISHKPILPTNGLRAFSQNITTLTSLTCSYIDYLSGTELFLIADSFPLLEELNLDGPMKLEENYENLRNGLKALSSNLFKLRKVDLSSHYYINDQLLYHLFNNWKLLEKADITHCFKITDAGIASAIRDRGRLTLRSLSFSTNFESVAALVNKCPSLSEIGLQYKYKIRLENSNPLNDVVVSPQIKSLFLTLLSDECIKIFVSLFPNLQLLNLRYCKNISDIAICEVLRRCRKIRRLDILSCSNLKLLGLNFEVSKLEVLNLSCTKIDDESLYVITKYCPELCQLLLAYCHDVTEKGVKHVVENCIQLKEINLKGCSKVHVNVVASLVSSRPSLRLITTLSILF